MIFDFQTVKVNSLRQLALNEISANGRNWYLTEALIEEGLVIKPTEKQVKDRIYSGSLYDLFLLLTVMVDLDKTIDVVETAHFHFTDCDQHFILKVSFCNNKPLKTTRIFSHSFEEEFVNCFKHLNKMQTLNLTLK